MRQTGDVPDARPGPTDSQARDDPLLAAYLARRAELVRFLGARTASHAEAEDLAQELYLKIVARAASPAAAEPVENPAALLYRMALNLRLDRARGEARAAARDADWRSAHAVLHGAAEVADEPPADQAVAARQRLHSLVAAVEGLPPQMRRAFTLHKLDGFSHAETARAMGISVKSVEKHVSAALKALTARLAP
jgi:RNA polymerase sigma-70 factor (ECF subfamily)